MKLTYDYGSCKAKPEPTDYPYSSIGPSEHLSELKTEEEQRRQECRSQEARTPRAEEVVSQSPNGEQVDPKTETAGMLAAVTRGIRVAAAARLFLWLPSKAGRGLRVTNCLERHMQPAF